MVKVYAWPPVGILASKWTRRAPIARSRSFISGARYISAMRRERIAAAMRVGGRSFDLTGHGYMEVLKDLLAGGENLVRLTEVVEPYPSEFSRQIGGWPSLLEWRGPTNQVITWRQSNGVVLNWVASEMYPATILSGTPRTIRIRKLPPRMTIIRPGQRVLAVRMPDGPHTHHMSAQKIVVDAQGNANIRLMEVPDPGVTHAVLRFRESAAFEVEGEMPEVMTVVNEEPIWDWKFLQVFPDEVSGGFQDEDPW